MIFENSSYLRTLHKIFSNIYIIIQYSMFHISNYC